MKKILISISFLLNIMLLNYVFIGGYKKVSVDKDYGHKISANYVQKNPIHEGIKKIAILIPATHPALEEIQRGFVETLAKYQYIKCGFIVYNANGNLSLMRAQLEDVICKDFDLLYTIGAHATQMAKEVTAKKQVLIPIVFGAVADPVKLGLVSNELFSGNNLTGSSATRDYAKQINFLLKVKPHVKNELIIYDPTQSSGLEKDKDEIVELLKKYSINTTAVEVYKTREIFEKIPSLLSAHDVVFIFKDNTVVPAVDGLVKLCSRYGVTLFVSDLDSVDKGAALGFGVHEYMFGVNAAQCALEILLEHKKPSEVPIRLTNNFKFKINSKTMQAQKVIIDSQQLALMQVTEIV